DITALPSLLDQPLVVFILKRVARVSLVPIGRVLSDEEDALLAHRPLLRDVCDDFAGIELAWLRHVGALPITQSAVHRELDEDRMGHPRGVGVLEPAPYP